MPGRRLLLLATPLALGAPTPGPRPPPALDPWSTALAAEAAPKPVRRHAATRARHMAQLRLGAHSLLADVSGLEHDF